MNDFERLHNALSGIGLRPLIEHTPDGFFLWISSKATKPGHRVAFMFAFDAGGDFQSVEGYIVENGEPHE